MANEKIKLEMFCKKVPQWKLAMVLGISEATLGRKFRVELSEEEQAKIMKILEEWKDD